MHVLQLLNVWKSQHNVTPTWHETHVARQNIFVARQSVDLAGVLSCRATLFECLPHDPLNLRHVQLAQAKTRNLHPRVRVDQAVRPLPPKTLSILVGLILKLISMCIMIYKVRKVWTVWFVLIMFLSSSLKECFSRIYENDEVGENCVRNRKSNSS